MPELPLIEPVPIEDEFCCGLARVENLPGATRLVFYTDQVRYEEGDRRIRVVSKKIIIPAATGFRLLRLVKV